MTINAYKLTIESNPDFITFSENNAIMTCSLKTEVNNIYLNSSFDQKLLMTIKIIGFSFLILTISSTIVFGQSGNKNVVLWSSTEKLTVDDFAIKVSNENSPSFAQFSIDYNVNGFDFLRRN